MRALEVGCGQAEFAIRLLEIFPSIEATGLDTNAHALAQARQQADSVGVGDRLTLIESSPTAAAASVMLASFEAALCVGPSQLFDSFGDALRRLAAYVKPGGLVFIADGYWKHEPNESCSALADALDHRYRDYVGIIATAEEAGLTPLYAIPGNDSGWDEHQLDYERAFDRYVAAHPNDTDAIATHDHVHALCSMYLRFGREMLGTGWVLFWRG